MGTVASVRDSATFNQVPLGTSVRPFDLDLRSFILPDLNLTLGKRNAFIGAGDRFELLPFDDSWVPFKIIPKFQLVLKTRLKSLHFYISHFVADGLIVSLVNRRTALVQELPAPKFKIWILLRVTEYFPYQVLILPHNNAEVRASEWRFQGEQDILSIHFIQDIVQSNLVRHLTVLEHVHEAHAGAREPCAILSYKN